MCWRLALKTTSMRRSEYRYYPKGATYGPPAPTKYQQIMATIQVIAIRHGVRFSDVMGQSRAWSLIPARQEAMYVLREKWGLSYERVGQIIGGRDHTTVLWGHKRHKARLAAEGRV